MKTRTINNKNSVIYKDNEQNVCNSPKLKNSKIKKKYFKAKLNNRHKIRKFLQNKQVINVKILDLQTFIVYYVNNEVML